MSCLQKANIILENEIQTSHQIKLLDESWRYLMRASSGPRAGVARVNKSFSRKNKSWLIDTVLHCDIVYHIRPLDLVCLRTVIDPEGKLQTFRAIPYQTNKKLRDKSWSILDVHALHDSLRALQSACGARAESWAALWSVFRSACRSACTSEQIQYFSISSYCKDKE